MTSTDDNSIDPAVLSRAPRDERAPSRALGRRMRWSRAAGLFGLGAGLAALASLAASLTASSAQRAGSVDAPVRVWVADRDAHRLVGLDGDLILVREIPIGWPLDVEVRADGGLWVLRSGNGTGAFGMRLTSISAGGAVENETWLERASDLALAGGRDALVVENGTGPHGSDRLWRIEPDGTAELVLERAALVCVTASSSGVFLASSDGAIVRVDGGSPAKVVAQAMFTATWLDLAPAPRPDEVFALDVGPPARLVLLGGDLAPLWTAAVGFEAHVLAVVPGEERVWLGDAFGARVRRFGPGGVLERDRTLSMLAPERGVAWADGGALFATPGAVLRLDGQGQPLPGQGGFQWLSDLARVP